MAGFVSAKPHVRRRYRCARARNCNCRRCFSVRVLRDQWLKSEDSSNFFPLLVRVRMRLVVKDEANAGQRWRDVVLGCCALR
jgi:hypothetical protein